jgi:hypothetical protein
VPELGRQASASSGSPEPGSGDPGDGPQDDWPVGSDGTPLSLEHQAWLDDEANIWPDDGHWNWPAADDAGDDPLDGPRSPDAAWPGVPPPATGDPDADLAAYGLTVDPVVAGFTLEALPADGLSVNGLPVDGLPADGLTADGAAGAVLYAPEPADPGSIDPGHADPGHADLGSADLGSADLGSADLGSAYPGNADPEPADLGPADPGPGACGPAAGGPTVAELAQADPATDEFAAVAPALPDRVSPGPGAARTPGTELAVLPAAGRELAVVTPDGAPESPGRRWGPLYAIGRQARNLLALALYTGLSLEVFGHWILSHMSTKFLSDQPQDASLFIWSFKWWNFATTHGLSAFYSKWDWAPGGVNLTWATTIPGPAYVMSWLTNGQGETFTYNVVELAAPALGAWTAYLLCRRITGTFFPALIGGFFFGFSPSVIDELGQGHPSLTLVFLVPLAAYVIVAMLQGALHPLAGVGLLGLVLGAQLYIGLEVYAMMTVAGGLCAITGFAFGPSKRRKLLLRTAIPVAAAYLMSAVLALPLLMAAFTSSRINKAILFPTIGYGAHSGSDLLRYFTPGKFTLFWEGFGHQWGDNPWYLGIPLVALIAAFLVTERRRRSTWPLFIALIVVLAISLGDQIKVFGANILPWRLLAFLPVLNIAQPGRVMTYIYLLVAVLVAMWLAQAKRLILLPLRWLLALGAAVMLLPNFPAQIWTTAVSSPAFITTGAYQQFISRGETVWLINSHPARQLLWQAQTDFYFRLPGGFFGGVPTGGPAPQPPNTGREERLGIGEIHPQTTMADITNFLKLHQVGAIVAANLPYPVIQELQAVTGQLGEKMLGVRVFQLGTQYTAPGAPHSP